jgi:hypothetical protein
VDDSATGEDRRQIWKVPPALPAVTLLLVSGVAALNIYGHPTPPARVFTLALGAVGLGAAISWLRMYLVADDEGVGVRHLRREVWTGWRDIDRVEVVTHVRGANTIRIARRNGNFVDVPPSLLQPALPMSKPRAIARLDGIARQINELGGRAG